MKKLPRLEDDPAYLFSLRVKFYDGKTLCLTACEGETQNSSTHTRIDIRARLYHQGKRQTIYRRGETYYGIPNGQTIDGKRARSEALSLICYDPLTPLQKSFVDKYGEDIQCISILRYGEL